MSLRRDGLTPALLVAALLCGAGQAQMIESFESDAYPRVSPSGCKIERVRQHATDGEWALKVLFPGSTKDTWPGLSVCPAKGDLDHKRILVFDVYSPHDKPVSLSYRIDSADGRKTFGGQTLSPKSATRVEIWLSHLAGKVDVANIVRVFPYLRMPREDRCLYFDHLRLETWTKRFKRIAYLELASPPRPTHAEEALGGLVFRRGELGHVFPGSVPWPGERTERIALFAARGEVEPVALSIRTLRALDDLAVSVSKLTSKHASLPDAAVELGCVRHLDKKVTYSSSEYIASLPTYVEPGSSFGSLPANTARTFWIRLRVPADATPGLYTGQILLTSRSAGGTGRMTLPLSLQVLPFSLPTPKRHFIGEYYRPRPQPSDEAWKHAVTADLKDMRDHGMTTVGLCFGLDTKRVKFEDGQFDLGLDGTTRFEHFMDTYVALGFPMPIVILSDSGQGAASKVGPYASPAYDQAYQTFWKTVQQTCKARGWPELIVQPVDEPGWRDQDAKDRNVRLLKILKQIPGMRTEQDGPGDGYFHNAAGPFADLWNYNGGIEPFDRIRRVRKQHLVAFYNNDVESYRPEVDRYVAGFFQKAADVDGVFNWEYRGGRGSLYDDMDNKTGDWVHHYPPSDTSKGGPSVAWEGAREGVDDLSYLLLLDTWLTKARGRASAASAVAKAQGILTDLIASLRASPRVRGRAQWSANWSRQRASQFAVHASAVTADADAAQFIAGVLKQPNGWSLRDYQRARWAVALSVLELMKACGQNVAVPAPTISGKASVTLAGYTPYPARRVAAKGSSSADPVATVPRLAQAPTLDGDLDDEAWKGGFRIRQFVPNSGIGKLDAEVQTDAIVGWHGETLYVGVRCREPRMGSLVLNCMEDGEPTHTDDCVELFFDPGVSRTRFAQLVFNAKGVQWSQTVRGDPWAHRVPVQTAKGEREWRVEVAVPLKQILAKGPDFGFNVCRERRAGGTVELSSWRPTGGHFGVPVKFAPLRLAEAETLVRSLGIEEEHRLEIRSADALALGTDHLAIDVEWRGEPAALAGSKLRLRLSSSCATVGEVTIAPPIPTRLRAVLRLDNVQPGRYRTEVSLVGKDGKTVETTAKDCRVVASTVDIAP